MSFPPTAAVAAATGSNPTATTTITRKRPQRRMARANIGPKPTSRLKPALLLACHSSDSPAADCL
jgi:hypothetical protein